MRLGTAKLLQQQDHRFKIRELSRGAAGTSGPHALRYTNGRDLLVAVALAARHIEDPQDWEHFLEDLMFMKFSKLDFGKEAV